MKEEYLLSGYLEETNQPYAIAKIAGIELCDSYRAQYGCNYISAMPTNLYGPNDNYDLEKSHVLPAMLRKFITARRNNAPTVTIWGTGTPKREFLHVNDLADACFYLMEQYNEKGLVNIGTGTDVTILELAQIIQQVTAYEGEIVLDSTKPDGTPRKLMDVSKLAAAGWRSGIALETGIQMVYQDVKDTSWND
jgi:GDP-L-fucose synthase